MCGWIKGAACSHIWHIHPTVAPAGSTLLKAKNWQSLDSKGKWKMLKCRNQSMETKVRKQKYGSEKKSRLSVSSALLTHDCVFWRCVAKGWLSPSYVRAVFQGSQTAVHGHHYHDATVSLGGQTQPKANDKWVNHPGYRCECCHSSSLKIFTRSAETKVQKWKFSISVLWFPHLSTFYLPGF